MTLRSRLSVPKMDCAAEERLVRMALEGRTQVKRVTVDLQAREVNVVHDGRPEDVTALLEPLGLGARLLGTSDSSPTEPSAMPTPAGEARSLAIVLAINAVMFVVELVAGFMADSSALVADSLDMFADATVYGLALWAVGKGRGTHLRAARVSGVLQMMLALGALAEVVRRLVAGHEPEGPFMIAVAAVALAANVACLRVLGSHRGAGAHMKASWIFTTNDVIANTGVILAGILVGLLDSPLPDIVVGTAIAILVMNGALRILRLKE
jgi:Co/Zn/Cd efflux system component